MSLLLQALLGANVDGSGSSFHADGRRSGEGRIFRMRQSLRGRKADVYVERNRGGDLLLPIDSDIVRMIIGDDTMTCGVAAPRDSVATPRLPALQSFF